MRKLKKLIDFLPYYFKSNDTYKDNEGKGLLEKYLEIFGNYFEDIIVTDIKSLSDILDISNTDDIYLGYLWEFLGQLPYANPQAIDPEKWKAYFNGLDDDVTIHRLSRYWLYPKDVVSGDLSLSESTVRSLLMYSVTLFKIRGTEKFFKTLMALYGLELEVLESQSSPVTKGEHGDNYDYAGSDDDYAGSDDDYGGMVDYYKRANIATKIDGSGATLNNGCTMDYTSVCNTCASIHFRLHIPTTIYNQSQVSNYIERIENVIKRFLPINVRPIFEWVTPSGTLYEVTNSRVLRPFVLVDTLPNSTAYFYNSSNEVVSEVFETLEDYPGWYLYLPDTLSNMRYRANGYGSYVEVHTKLSELSWLIGTKVRVMVLIMPVNSLGVPINLKSNEELDPIYFTINNGELEYSSGHIFDITIGASKTPTSIEPKPVLLDDYWEPWYTYEYPVVFNSMLKRVSYKFGVDYNSDVEVITSFDYGSRGSIPILSYKEVATLVNGEILSTLSSPVNIIWNNDIEHPLVPTPLVTDLTRYRYVVEPETSGEQSFYMVENPARNFIVITTVNKLSTQVVITPSTLQLDNDNPTVKARLDVKLGDGSIKIPDTLPGYEVDAEYLDWFNNNVTVNENRGLSNVYYSGTFTPNLNGINSSTQLKLLIPITNKPIHNTSQYLVVTCIGTIDDPDHDNVQVTLKVFVNLLTKVVSFVQLDEDGSKYTGKASFYSILEDITDSNLITIEDEDYDYEGYYVKGVTLSLGLLAKGYSNSMYRVYYEITPTSFYWTVETISSSDLVVRSVRNKDLVYNAGELAEFSRPGIQEFKSSYSNDISFSLVDSTSGVLDIASLINSGIKYTLEIIDDNYLDNRANTIRIPYRFSSKSDTQANIKLNINLFTNLNQVDGIDTETQYPNYFDWDVMVIWGSNPMGQLLATLTCDDDSYNEITDPYTGEVSPAEHYGKTGELDLVFNKLVNPDTGDILDRDYNPSSTNFPPGLYTIMMHSRSPMEGQDYYQVIELYEDRDPDERQLHIDVDVISRAWLNPVGINGSINSSRTWGYYKSHLESMVTDASYDIHVEVPEFRVLLSNNNIGYKKVWLYKALSKSAFIEDSDMVEGNLNYRDLEYTDDDGESIIGERSTPVRSPGTGRAWIFTGTVYDIGALVKGPEEPGMYMLVVHQTTADKVTIGKAYLEVKENANYILRINPTAAVLEQEDTAVSTEITVTNDAIWPKKLRLWSAATNQYLNLQGTGDTAQTLFPVTFLAYTAGIYDFTVYWYNEDSPNQDKWEILENALGPLQGTFNVVRNTTLSPESRVWTYDGNNVILTVDLVMVSSDRDIPWTAIISEDQ